MGPSVDDVEHNAENGRAIRVERVDRVRVTVTPAVSGRPGRVAFFDSHREITMAVEGEDTNDI